MAQKQEACIGRASQTEKWVFVKKSRARAQGFLKNDFLPFAETKHAAKPLTYRYYKQGSDLLTKSAMAGLQLQTITDQHAQAFAAKHSAMSASGINRGFVPFVAL